MIRQCATSPAAAGPESGGEHAALGGVCKREGRSNIKYRRGEGERERVEEEAEASELVTD